MKTIINAHPKFPVLLDIWRRAQRPMYKVKRWGKFPRHIKIQQQSTLEHSYSICILVDVVIQILSRRRKIDGELLRRAFLFHDFGEGILRRDVLLHDKTDEKDLAEYCAVKKVFSSLGKSIWRDIERAYLLQFASRNPACFPSQARIIMSELWKTKKVECLLFFGIEVLDYILYPLSHEDETIAPEFFAHVIGGNAPKLDALAKELPEFGEEIWLPAVSDATQKFMQKNGNGAFFIKGKKFSRKFR